MAKDVRTVLQKADTGVATLAAGGLLSAEDARQFIKVAIKGTVIARNATVKPMKNPKLKVPRMRFNDRVLRKGTEATALALAERSVPNLGEVELDSKLLKAELRISKEALEDNIEGKGWLGNLRNAIAEAARRDLDDLLYNGDTASADTFLNTLDGVRKQVTANTFDAGNTFLNKGILRDTIKALPVEFQSQRSRMFFHVSPNMENQLRDSLADRATMLGDKMVVGADSVRIQGSHVQSVDVSPEDLGVDNKRGELIYIDPKNVYVGFHRVIEMESDIDISAGVLIVVLSMRVDVKVAVPEAAVKTTTIKVAA